MPLLAPALPTSTPFDPAEDPQSSIDPMGTLAHAERLVEVLLPGMTARMWRARFLTVGEAQDGPDPVIERLMRIPRAREASGSLIVPGRPSERDPSRPIVALASGFRDAWARAWRLRPEEVSTYCRPRGTQGGESTRSATRRLGHAAIATRAKDLIRNNLISHWVLGKA